MSKQTVIELEERIRKATEDLINAYVASGMSLSKASGKAVRVARDADYDFRAKIRSQAQAAGR